MATRYYLPSTGTPSISPSIDAGWETSHSLIRRNAVTTKISSAMTTIARTTDGSSADQDICFVQYISGPIAAQTISAQTLKFQMRQFETSTNNNLFTAIGVRVLSSDGGTVRGTILAVSRDNVELAVNTLTNRQFSATTTEVVTQNNDVIVIEVGFGGDPSPASARHNGSISIGDDSATDLGENDTDTAAYNPWVQFTNDILTGIRISLDSATISASGQHATMDHAIPLDSATLSATAQTIKKSLWLIIDHETGDDSQYTTGFIGNASVTADSALAGTSYGVKVINAGSVNSYAIYELSTPVTGILQVRFYFDPNGTTIPEFEGISLGIFSSSDSVFLDIGIYGGSSSLEVSPAAIDDSASYNEVTPVPITDSPICIETRLIRATTNSSSDGYLQWWLNGVEQAQISGVDNYDCFSDFAAFSFGVLQAIGGGYGTIYLDELIVNDIGAYIGIGSYNISIPLDTGSLTATPQTITVDAPIGTTTIELSNAIVTATSQVSTLLKGEVITILDVATISVTAQNITVAVGEKTTVLDTALITIAGQILEADSGIPPPTAIELFVAQLTSSAQILSVIEGAVSVTLNNSSVSANGQALSVVEGEITIQLDSSSISTNAGTITIGKGEVHLYFDSAALAVTAQTIRKALWLIIDFETGDLTQFTATNDPDGNELNVTTQAALAGTDYGLAVDLDDTDNIYGYVQFDSPSLSGIVRARLYFDPNSITTPTADNFEIAAFGTSNTGFVYFAAIEFNISGTEYFIRPYLIDDTVTIHKTSFHQITDEPHYIEILIARATSNVASDGYLSLWIDGVFKETLSGIDNYDRFYRFYRFPVGAWYVDATTLGTIYHDEIIVNDTGDYIGPRVYDVIIPLDSATISASPQVTTVMKGERVITLSNASIATTGQSITVDTGAAPPITINLDNAVISAIPQAITLVKGEYTTSLSVPSIQLVSNSITLSTLVNIELSNSLVSAQAQLLSVDSEIPSETSISLDNSQITITPEILSVIKGQVTINLNVAQITSLEKSLGVVSVTGILLDAGLVSVVGQSLTSIVDVVIPLFTASLSVIGQPVTVIEDITIILDIANINVIGIDISPTVGVVIIPLDNVSLTLQSNSLFLLRDVIISIDASILSITANDIIIATGEISIPLSYGILSISANSIGIIALVDILVDLNSALLEISCEDLYAYTGSHLLFAGYVYFSDGYESNIILGSTCEKVTEFSEGLETTLILNSATPFVVDVNIVTNIIKIVEF